VDLTGDEQAFARRQRAVRPPNSGGARSRKNTYDTTTIPVQDAAITVITPNGPVVFTNLNYRSANWSGIPASPGSCKGSVSYVTGSHSAKFGARYHQNDSTFPKNYYNNAQVTYQLSGGLVDPANNIHTAGAPTQLTMFADQGSQQRQQQASSRSTHRTAGPSTGCRASGLRYEHLGDHFGEQKFGPNVFLPTAIVFADQDGPLHLSDIQPAVRRLVRRVRQRQDGGRSSSSGATVTTTNTVDEWASYSPAGAGHFVTSTTRSWNDRGRPRDQRRLRPAVRLVEYGCQR
jgi:hypothetical protein